MCEVSLLTGRFPWSGSSDSTRCGVLKRARPELTQDTCTGVGERFLAGRRTVCTNSSGLSLMRARSRERGAEACVVLVTGVVRFVRFRASNNS